MDRDQRRREREDLLLSFDQGIPRVRVPITYRLALVFVTIAMVLLPLIYVGLVALLGYGLFWHATENISVFVGDRNSKVKALIYLTPLFAGGIVLIFLLKPLLAKRKPEPPHFALRREDQPYLFDFVDRLCDAVGAPRPNRIDVDTEVNASAGLRRGFASFFRNDLVLTIGLPLVSGFKAPHLAGVLAHEFGHFSQAGGMRFGYAIRRVNRWFSRVVYERDSWDERLDRWQRKSDFLQAQIIVGTTRGCVWLSRRILWVLRQIGLILSSYLSRQMEFDADRYEAGLVGVDVFRQTTIQLRRVSIASNWAQEDLRQSSRRGKLADDVPALVMDNLAHLAKRAEFDQQIRKDAVGGTRRLLSTHPTSGDRIASVERDGSSGVLTSDAPAEVLFDNYDELCRQVTTYHYEEEYELDLDHFDLVPTASLTASINAQQARYQQVYRHFGGVYPTPRRIWSTSDNDLAEAQKAQRALVGQAESVTPQLNALNELLEQEANLVATAAVLRCTPEEQKEVRELESALEEIRQSIEESDAALNDWAELATASLSAKGTGGSSAEREEECRRALATLREFWPQRRQVIVESETLERLLGESTDEIANLSFAQQESADRLFALLSAIQSNLKEVPHPFRSDGFGETLLDDLLPECPSEGSMGDLLRVARRLTERSGSLSIAALAPFARDPIDSSAATEEA